MTVLPDTIRNIELPLSNKNEEIVKHIWYTLSYSEKYEQAKWVAYKLTKNMVVGNAKRKNNFRPDPMVSNASASPDDYIKSGYDRGHLCPAADMKWSDSAMSETFFMSNMSPQVPYFNRGIWKKLEEKVRNWATENEEIYVVTAGVLTDNLLQIGKQNKVAVPKYFYKVILDLKEPEVKAIAFILPNEKSSLPLQNFVVTIDSVEKLTGLDFFPALPDRLENLLEGKTEMEKWLKSTEF